MAEICNNGDNLANCIISFYNTSGSDITKIYYHNSSLANGAGDNSYRYAGASDEVNNYVCFGSDASTCTSNNLYRIIGVFDGQVKLIKSTSYGNYYWSGSSYNTGNAWSNSTLNTSTLNGTYLNNLESYWSNFITNHTWKVGETTSSQRNNQPSLVFEYEVGANSSSTIYSAKIGLMYISDYGFAASNSYWSTTLNNANISINNWLYMGLSEWTISSSLYHSDSAFLVYNRGDLTYTYVYDFNGYHAVRPSFYLESSTEYSSGSGTESDPIRIVV